MSKDSYTERTFKIKWRPQDLLEDFKIGEYHSTREYFTVVAEAFTDAIRQRCASKNIWWIEWYL